MLSPGLTPRELDLVRGVLAGKRNKEIAFELGITENTVKVYLCRLYAKFGVTNGRLEFALKMIEAGHGKQ